MKWNAAKSHCGSLSLGGSSDWRLPTINELRSLIRGCPATQKGGACGVTNSCLKEKCWKDDLCKPCSVNDGPGPDGAYWPPELSGDVFWYWSSSPVADDFDGLAWSVYFQSGNIGNGRSLVTGGYGSFARCVRYNPEDSTPDTWKDPQSGLTWQVFPTNGNMNWASAKAHCKNLSLGGFNDWRIPTISELRSLIRGCQATEKGGACGVTDSCLNDNCWKEPCQGCSSKGDSGLDGAYWPPELSGEVNWYSGEDYWYWSSSAVADHNGVDAWTIGFKYGLVNHGTYVNNIGKARCVR